jgi:hypothetical protein
MQVRRNLETSSVNHSRPYSTVVRLQTHSAGRRARSLATFLRPCPLHPRHSLLSLPGEPAAEAPALREFNAEHHAAAAEQNMHRSCTRAGQERLFVAPGLCEAVERQDSSLEPATKSLRLPPLLARSVYRSLHALSPAVIGSSYSFLGRANGRSKHPLRPSSTRYAICCSSCRASKSQRRSSHIPVPVLHNAVRTWGELRLERERASQ